MNEQPPFLRTFADALRAGGGVDLASLLKSFASSAEGTNSNLTTEGLTRLQNYLSGVKLRYFVYRSSGFGNQANTINLLKRMIALGFKNDVELIYDATDGSSVIDKLAVLLPGLDPENPQPYTLGTVTIDFYAYTETPGTGGTVNRTVTGLTGEAPLCINGGAEITSITDENLANALQVDHYVQLQPYMWEIVNTTDNPVSLILEKDAEAAIDLAEQATLQYRNFSYRAFAMPMPVAPQWDELLEIPGVNVNSVGRAKAVATAVSAQKIMSFPVYGLYDTPFARKPVVGAAPDMAFELIAAGALAQKTGKPFNKPIVVGLLNTLQDSTFETLSGYFPTNGETLPDEDTSDMEQDEKIAYFTKRWCAANGLFQPGDGGSKPGNIHLLTSDMTGVELTTALDGLTGTDVAVVYLPSQPQDSFNYLYEIASLPSVFEGQGTANMALNLGKPFFKLAKTGVNPYPSDLGNAAIGEEVPGEPSTASVLSAELYDASYNLIQLGTYRFKYGFEGKMPPQLLADLLVKQAADYASNGPYRQYFDGLKAYFASAANDKLLQALVFLVTEFDLGEGATLHSLQQMGALGADQTPLEQLYTKIEGAISNGILSLIPTVIPNGPFADFITAIIEGNDFIIGSPSSPVEVVFPADHNSITVTGRTLDFLGVALMVKVVFTMNADGKSIDTAFNLDVGTVNLNGVAWFTLESLTIDATIPGNNNRLTGSVATKIKVGDNPISFAMDFPTSADGKIVINGDLSENPPSLNDLFTLLGGMNFMNTLPSQISAAGNIQLKQLKFGYSYSNSLIETFDLTLENTKEWPLFGKLQLENLSFNMTLLEPTGSRTYSWLAKTSVMIGPAGGDPTKYGSIDVSVSYPNLTVSASLADNSPAIPIGDLVTFFLPANYSINLNANLGNFDMNVTPGENGAETVYAVSAGIDLTNWDLSLGVATFSLTNIYINVEGTGSATPTGTLAATTVLFSDQPDIAVTMNLTAIYAENGAWSFMGVQGDNAIKVKQIIQTYLGSGWWIDGMPNLDISDLAFNVQSSGSGSDTAAKSYMVGGTITAWPDNPLGSNFQSIITGKFGSGPSSEAAQVHAALCGHAEVPVLDRRGATVPMQPKPMLLAANDDGTTSYGNVSARIIWNNIDLTVFYNYDKGYNSYGFFWGPLSAKIDSKTNTATLKFTDSTSLGSMVEIFVSWLTGSKFGLGAPWNILDKITLSDFEIIWNFQDNSVKFSVDIGPIDLIFAKITGFSIEYVPKGANAGVQVSLDGNFLWQLGEGQGDANSLTWNAADPASTPAPPGGGNKYVDLRLLAAGQHVQVDGLQQITSVQDAIKILGDLPVPDGTSIPPIGFDGGNNWLFATDFGILKIESGDKSGEGKDLVAADDAAAAPSYTFTLQVVFTDPTLYALRIALEGDAAKVFAGLDFQIIYRKISDGLGVFQAEITLPTIMRRIDVGAYTITLPTFGVEIYTNGDFQFDIGFPWNEDFARSFSVEAIIPPGIPALGSGGFYFGKLPAVAVNQLPVAVNGFFNPNLVFGFGAQIGLGKSIDMGILKAGFSLTVFGIIEGILAKWNPYDGTSTGGGNQLALQGEYYFWLQGTFGILGRLYGSVDFVIIKASVDINLKLYAQITLASYEPIPITVSASVSVSAKATINLGLFKISMSFSFSAHIKESFTLGYLQNPKDAPWQVASASDGGRLMSAKAERLGLLRSYMLDAAGMPRLKAVSPNWGNLKAATGGPASLTGYLGYGLTIAGDEAFGGATPDLTKQFPSYVASLFIDAPGTASGSGSGSGTTNMLRAAGESSETSFETLAKMVARWAVASVQSQAMTPDQIDALVVTDDMLASLIDYLSDGENVPMPLAASDVDTFLGDQFKMTVSLPTDAGSAEATYFPMALDLNIKMPSYGSNPDIDYTFADYNTVSDDFVSFLREYFNQLAVQVEAESGDGLQAEVLYENDAISVASFIYSDYFVLVMRQMLQSMRDGLRDFNYALAAGDKPNDIVSWTNSTGDLTTAGTPFTLYDLFKGNETHPLTVGKTIKLPFVPYTISGGDSFTTIAAAGQFGSGFDATSLATNNAAMAGLLVAGTQVTYSGTPYVISGSETLNTLAGRIDGGVSLADLFANSDILTQTDVLQAGGVLTVPPFSYTTVENDNLQGISTAHGITVQDIAGVDRETQTNPIGTENGDIADLFIAADDKGNPLYLDLVYLPQFQVGELLAEAQRVNALNHLSGMASRYYFHGLRLPTEKITPNKEGMWVKKDGTTGDLSLPTYAGLFALTGQQLPLTSLPTEPLAITLSKGSTIDWLEFANSATDLTFTITPPTESQTSGDTDFQRLSALTSYAASTVLPAGPKTIDARATVEDEAARYPLSNGIRWQSGAAVTFPTGGSGSGDQPRIWPLPSSMVALSGLGGLDQSALLAMTNPNFELQSVRMNEATGKAEDTSISRLGWASSIEFTVKKLPTDGSASKAYQDTYEIAGASAADTIILERIVQYVTDDSAFASMAVGFQSASSSAGTTLQAEVGPSVTFGVSQVNLSTVTQPPAFSGVAAFAESAGEQANILNKPTELVRLLWEASITRSGGFFLYYFDADANGGLPDEAFNDKGEATVTLVIMYQNQPRLQPYMNAVATGDPIDTSNSTLVAKAVSNKESHTVQDGDTLASIAGLYYSNLVSMVDTTIDVDGGDIELASGAVLAVNNGVYRVPVDGSAPGGKLSDIASHFNMDADAIKAANPRVPAADWTGSLPNGSAIRLPAVNRTVGTDPGGSSFNSMAAFYGTSAGVLAGHNAATNPLLKAGQSLSLMTGPLSQHGSQVAGVQPVLATRAGLPDIPDDPTDPNFAADFLLNDYTLLAYQIDASFDFEASNLGLPLGQQADDTSVGDGKPQTIRALTADDDLNYKTSVPYVQFAVDSADPDNPYSANGRLLQIGYNWNDLYGNRIVSSLDDDSDPVGAGNNAPSLTGYTDKLLTVGQWPSTSTSWTVADTKPVGDQFLLQVTSSFDPTAFNPSADDPSDAWITRANSSLQTLNTILNQINDPNGIGFYVATKLLSETTQIDPAQIGTGTDYGKSGTLTGWMVPIQTFLSKRAQGDSSAPVPTDLDFTLSVMADKSAVSTDEVFLLTLDLTIKRTGGVAEGDFAAVAAVKEVTSSIAAMTNAGTSPSASGSNMDVLKSFASDIESTLSQAGKYTLTVATGSDRYKPAAGTSQSAVWAVRLGADGSGQGISFSINDAGKPEIFAPEPISNTLISKGATIYPYTQLTDFDPATNSFTTTAVDNSYAGVEADNWVEQFFSFFDTLFSPEFTSSILVVDAKASNKPKGVDSFLTALADQKETLANVASELMGPVYDGQTSTRLNSAKETFKQSLLVKLSNLYSTRAAVSFGATVIADIPQAAGEEDPQLFGNLSWNSDDAGLESLVTLTSPKMPLVSGDNQPITFLLESPSNIKVDGEVVQEVTLDLSYAGAAIEHQVAQVPGIEGYVASSWLSPVRTGDAVPLEETLGSFTVPLLLRSFPSTPRMSTQSGEPTIPDADKLNDLTKWTYDFTYSLDFHFEQDRVYGEVVYNIQDKGMEALAGFVDAFQGLAQFITYQDKVSALIGQTVPQVDAKTTDQQTIDNASLALGAFLKMATDIATQANAANSLRMMPYASTLGAGETYSFYISEATQKVTISSGDQSVWVATLTSTDGAPSGLTGNPAVQIDGYSEQYIESLSDPSKGIYAYYYTDSKGNPLLGATAQGIEPRNVALPGMQILARQDALSTVYLTRNENIGGKINKPFVYQTPDVSFGNPLHPTIKSAQPVDIAKLGPAAPQTLDTYLSALFTALFEQSFSGDSTIQINVTYDYAFSTSLSEMSVQTPVAVLPPLSVNVGGTGQADVSLDDMVKTVSDAIADWKQAYAPSTIGALLQFEVIIMSNLTVNPMPLLSLSDLYLNVGDIKGWS